MMQEVIFFFSFVKSVDLFAAIILQEILASALGHCLDAGGYIVLEYYSVHSFGELRIKKSGGANGLKLIRLKRYHVIRYHFI